MAFKKIVSENEIKSSESVSVGLKLKRKIYKNMYGWHRIIGIISVVPVIFWTLSGIMHPFMSHWFKPVIAHEFIPQPTLVKEKLQIPFNLVLQQNNISQLQDFRIVEFRNEVYYQIQLNDDLVRYFSTADGHELVNGDKIYAEWMARYLIDDQISTVKDISKVTKFGGQYKIVNRLLPVYQVQFDRSDGMDVFVETTSTRMGTYNNNARKAFIWIFSQFHDWEFLQSITNITFRTTLMVLLLTLIIFSAVSGLIIYGLMWRKFAPSKAGDSISKIKKYHRAIGLATSFIVLTFAVSGAYHALYKLVPDNRIEYNNKVLVKTSDQFIDFTALPLEWGQISNIKLASIKDIPYYQILYKPKENNTRSSDFYNAVTGEKIQNGEKEYAQYLAVKFYSKYKGDELPNLVQMNTIKKLDGEYGFVNKRIPVIRLDYQTDDHLSFYVETNTGYLGAILDDGKRREGFSFAFFHKYEGMKWAGKNARDIITMIAAAGLLVVSLLGLYLFIKK